MTAAATAAQPATWWELTQALEAALFLGLEPIDPAAVVAAWPRWSLAEVRSAIAAISARYRRQGRPYFIQRTEAGLILQLGGHWQDRILAVLHPDKAAKLPKNVVDVLAIVAYQQPITREAIEALIEADPRPALRQLQKRELVDVQVESADGDTLLSKYCTTDRFLRVLGLSSLDDLPRERRAG